MDKAEQGRRQLLELLGDAAGRPVDEVIHALHDRERGVSPAVDLATVIARREEFRERLLAELALTPAEVDARAGAVPSDRHAYCLHTFALYLLALWQEPRAFGALLAYLAADPDAADAQLDDILTEDGPAILARTYDGQDLGPLKALIENADAPPFLRDACLRALHAMSRLGKLDRDEVVAYVEAFASGMDVAANEAFIDILALSIAALQDARLRPIIDRWYADGLIDRTLIPPADIDEVYKASYDELNEELTRHERFEGLVDELSGWAWFTGKEADPPVFDDDPETMLHEPYRLEGRKIGRNEACPCGSGRKYKKCCLGADPG